MKWLSAICLLLFCQTADAQVWFNAVPNTITDSVIVDPTGHTKVNGNFNSLVTDGNTGLTALEAAIAAIPAGTGVPSGAVIIWTGLSCPTGYHTADGTSGTADARGVYIRGLDTGGAVDPARTLASLQLDQFITHSHSAPSILNSLSQSPQSTGNSGATAHFVNQVTTSAPAPGTSTITTVGVQGAIETRPDSVVELYCQKL